MKTLFLLIIGLLATINSKSQNIVSGRVVDENKKSLPGVNIALQDSYDGTSTDTAGNFSFSTSETGVKVLQLSFIGYKRISKEITIGQNSTNLEFQFELEEAEIPPVTITAGTFETGDLRKSLTLKPLDIAMTPSALGDIYGAFTTLPGSQIVGNEGGLYVRGGEGYETKTFIDGMLVANPYESRMPDLPTRGRFSPMLFEGTAFSTGAYSAEYGQALSSEMNLTTTGLAERSARSVSIFSVGLSASITERWANSSLSINPEYYNMQWVYSLLKTNMEWKKHPESIGGTMLFRKKLGKSGMLKTFGSFTSSNSILYYKMNGDTVSPQEISMNDYDIYFNAVYTTRLATKWSLKSGGAISTHKSTLGIGENELSEPGTTIYQKTNLTNSLNEYITLKFGQEISWHKANRDYYDATSGNTYPAGFSMYNFAIYTEPTIQFSKKLILRTGLRAEVSTMNEKIFIEPRISFTYKIANYGSLALAYGNFHQRAEDIYLVYNKKLDDLTATHYILNYQWEKNERIFRAEAFYKKYNKLVKYISENSGIPDNYNNLGKGYASGIDFFWRDSKTIKRLDYWATYSFIDTKREYKNFSSERKPTFVSDHTFSFVSRYQLPGNYFYICATWMYATAKTYYNPVLTETNGNKTTDFKDVSLSLTYVAILKNFYMVFFGSLNNVLGFDNTFGYNYSASPNTQGEYSVYPIKSQNKRFFVLGLIFNF